MPRRLTTQALQKGGGRQRFAAGVLDLRNAKSNGLFGPRGINDLWVEAVAGRVLCPRPSAHRSLRGADAPGRLGTVFCVVPMRAADVAPRCARCHFLRPYEHRALRGVSARGRFSTMFLRGVNVCGRLSTVLCEVSMRAAVVAPCFARCQCMRPHEHRALRGVNARGLSCTTLCEVSMYAAV